MTPGSLAIYLAAALAATAFVSAIRWARGNAPSETTFRLAYHGMTAALALASLFLMLAILTHDFRYHYVIGYTSRDLPLLYLISAFWGGQQGTYLLWALMGALIGYPLFRKGSWEPAAVMACYVPTIGFLIALMLDPDGNPFRLAARVPADGNGLNPLLQDPWMASHPPAVFLGYAALTVPGVLALVALFKKREDVWLGPALRWSLVSFITLGIGVVLGGFWAYKVLGWGGYWGWDPVENASLVPWIVVTALIHGILVQKATGALRVSNLMLALAGYLTVFYATFLTRSGVLADFSVHSFPQGAIYRYLLAILLIILGTSVFALVRRRGPQSTTIPFALSWPFVLTATIVLFAISAAFVLFGTSWPILSNLAGKPTVPGPAFYNQVSLPLYVVLLGLLGIAPFLGWNGTPRRAWMARVATSIAVGLAGTGAAYVLGGHGFKFLLLFFTAIAAVTSNAIRLVQVARVRPMNTGAAITHIGFGLMFVGIVASSTWGTHVKELRLPLGQPVETQGLILTYRGHVAGSDPESRWRVAVLRPGRVETTAEVTMYRLPGRGDEESIFRKPAILREWTRDIYLAPLALETGSGHDHTVDLVKGQPTLVHGTELTFLRFDTHSSSDAGGMTVRAIVQVGGERPEEIALPFTVGEEGSRGEPVRPASLPGTTLSLQAMSVEQGIIRVQIGEGGGGATETLILQASIEPLMGVLWTGTILLGLGCTVAVIRRYREYRVMQAAGSGVGIPLAVGTARPATPPARGRKVARIAATGRGGGR